MVLAWTLPNVAGESSIEDIVSERVREKFQRSLHDSKSRSAESGSGETKTYQFDMEGRVGSGGDGDVRPRHRVGSQTAHDAESSETEMPNSTTSSIRGSSTDVWTSSSDHSATESETENEDTTSQRSTATSGSTEEEWSYYVEAAESKVEPEPDDRGYIDVEEDRVVDEFRWMIRNVRMSQPETILEEAEQPETLSAVWSQLKLDERFTETKHEQQIEECDQDSPRTVVMAKDQPEIVLEVPAKDVDVDIRNVRGGVVGDDDRNVDGSLAEVKQTAHGMPEIFETVVNKPENTKTMENTEASSAQLESNEQEVTCITTVYTLEKQADTKVTTKRRRRHRDTKSSQIDPDTAEMSTFLSGDSSCDRPGQRLHDKPTASGDWRPCEVKQKIPSLQPDERGDHAGQTLFESTQMKVTNTDICYTSRAQTSYHSLLRHLSLEDLPVTTGTLKKESSTDTEDYLSPERSSANKPRKRKRPHSAPANVCDRTRTPHSTAAGTALSGGNEVTGMDKSKLVTGLDHSSEAMLYAVETDAVTGSAEQETVVLTGDPLKMASLQETLHMYLESQRATPESPVNVSPPVESQPSPTAGTPPSESLPLPVNFAAYREVTPEEKCIAYALATSQLDSSTDTYKETCSVPAGQTRLEWVITEGTPFQVNRMMSGGAQVFGESPNLPFLVESSTDKMKSAPLDTDYDSVSSVSSFSHSTSSAESVRERSNTDLSIYSDPSDIRSEEPVEVARVPSYLSFGSPSAAIAVSNQRQNLYQATATCFSAAFLPKKSRHSASDDELYPSFIGANLSDRGPRVRKAGRKVTRTRSFSPVSGLGQRASKDAVRRRIIGPNASGARPKSADCEALFTLDYNSHSQK